MAYVLGAPESRRPYEAGTMPPPWCPGKVRAPKPARCHHMGASERAVPRSLPDATTLVSWTVGALEPSRCHHHGVVDWSVPRSLPDATMLVHRKGRCPEVCPTPPPWRRGLVGAPEPARCHHMGALERSVPRSLPDATGQADRSKVGALMPV